MKYGNSSVWEGFWPSPTDANYFNCKHLYPLPEVEVGKSPPIQEFFIALFKETLSPLIKQYLIVLLGTVLQHGRKRKNSLLFGDFLMFFFFINQTHCSYPCRVSKYPCEKFCCFLFCVIFHYFISVYLCWAGIPNLLSYHSRITI